MDSGGRAVARRSTAGSAHSPEPPRLTSEDNEFLNNDDGLDDVQKNLNEELNAHENYQSPLTEEEIYDKEVEEKKSEYPVDDENAISESISDANVELQSDLNEVAAE